MKRLILLFLLLLIPLSTATIVVEGPSKEIYNLGDKIEIKGYITVDTDLYGILKASLNCDQEIPILVKSISLRANTKKSFDEESVIPFLISGGCSLKISVESAGSIIEQALSDNFVISKELKGDFKLEDKLIQLGKDIVLSGGVYKLDGTNVNGNAILYFKQNETFYNVGSTEIKDGKLSFIQSSVAYPSGNYMLEIQAIDNFGNDFTFTDIEPFTLVNEIYVFAKPDKISVMPGTVVNIIGEAKTILQEKIDEGKAAIIFNGTRYETELKDSKFEYELVLEKNSKSGRHDIEVVVEDKLGNIGRTTTNFNVNAIPTKLFTESEAKTYIPGTKIKFKPVLLDQGGDFIIEDISAELIDSGNDVKLSKVVKTNEYIEHEFDKYALPGTWVIKIYASGLVHEDQIYVGETLAADFSIEGQELVITNIGNIAYKKPVEIRLEGEQTYNFIAKERLKPGESFKFNLGKGVKTGTYDVYAGDKVFKDIQIEGFIEKSYVWLYAIIILAVLLTVLFFFLRNIFKKKREKRRKEEEEKNLAEKVKEFLGRKGLYKKETIKKPETKEERMQRYRKELREQLLKDVEKREKKIRQDVSKFIPLDKEEYIEIKPKKDEEKKNLFRSIFSRKHKDSDEEE